MPGILPMKVIKVGTSAQSRIAQACDRCRSKKIRCDGVTPCCSQCANVGFECKTSDKLSRRAFPRGYTESLEERVRSLEAEVKELKDLLDEKDEKIDILSRIRSNSSSIRRPSDTIPSLSNAVGLASASSRSEKPLDSGSKIKHTHPFGASSGRPFVDAFRTKLEASGKLHGDFQTEAFFRQKGRDGPLSRPLLGIINPYIPPRMASDQMINVFFQEWAPLFPVLHRPSFLEVYAGFVADPANVRDKNAIAQLYLVFGIASLSTDLSQQDAAQFELIWQSALESAMEEKSLATLQSFLLAQLFLIARCDYGALQRYRSIAATLSWRLGLHEKERATSFGVLETETRRKTFWTLYTLDCFSAAMLGLPKLLNDADIRADLPADIDDENVSEGGFHPTLPGETTRLSSALGLFQVSRILSRVLDELYPADLSPNVSTQKLGALKDELDAWFGSLPPHLRLHFIQEKPSTNVTGSRSPFLALAYHYIRSLIYRPTASSNKGSKVSTSMVALAQSSKHIIQISQLLDERRMSWAFCLNKEELLLLAGFGLLYQILDLDRKGKLIQDSQRLICSAILMLERASAPGAAEFKKVACTLISVHPSLKINRSHGDSRVRRKTDGKMAAPKNVTKSARRLSATASHPSIKQEGASNPSLAVPQFQLDPTLGNGRSSSQQSLSSALSDPISRCTISERSGSTNDANEIQPLNPPNLDYFDFSNDTGSGSEYMARKQRRKYHKSEVKDPSRRPLCVQAHSFVDGVFPSPDVFSAQLSTSTSGQMDWGSDLWAMNTDMYTQPPASNSIPSLSEGDPTEAEDTGGSALVNGFSGIEMNKGCGMVGLDMSDQALEL